MYGGVKEAFTPLSRAESVVATSGTPHFKLCFEQSLLSSWWSDCHLKYCCKPALATQRYGIHFLGDINTSATTNRKKLLWFSVSFQGLSSIQTFVSGLHIFSGDLDKILQKLSYFIVRNKKKIIKKIKNKNPNLKQISKKWNLQKEKNPGVFNQISAYNFCVWYTSSHNITFKELETSKAMFVGRNHVLFEQLIKLEKAGGIQALHQVWNGDCRLQSFKAPVRCVKWLDSVWATTWILTTHKGPPGPHHQHPASYSHPSMRAVCFTPCLTWWKPHRGKGTTTVHWGELTWTVDRPLIRRRALLRQQPL